LAMITAYIGLGSNLDNPLAQVNTALGELDSLPQTHKVGQSSCYRSDPHGPPGQPDYINAVACLQTELPAHDLLDALQSLEQQHQRVRIEHWGPRTLDLDLLLYGEQIIDTERLQVPHPWLAQRSFVLYPLAEITPNLVLPSGQTLASLLTLCDAAGLDRLPTKQ